MRSFKNLALAASALVACMLLVPAKPAHADPPKYLHALADLRMAQKWIAADGRPQFAGQRKKALDEIYTTIVEIKKAVVENGASPDFTPPPQSSGNPNDPIKSAKKLLDEARKDVSKGEDVPQNVGSQVRALQHLDGARAALDEILEVDGGH
jgi:hypothetical protein